MKRTKSSARLLTLLFSLTAIPAFGIECINQQSCPPQIERLQQYASDGSPEAQLLLGALLDDGVTAQKNEKQAFFWFKQAATKSFNYPTANFFVGRGYLFGKGVEQNLKQAKYYLKRSARSGYPSAQQLLGLEYLNGENFSQDLYAARTLLEKAADNNAALAAFYVAGMYQEGAGGKQDPERAKHFYLVSAGLQFKPAIAKLASILTATELEIWKTTNPQALKPELATIDESKIAELKAEEAFGEPKTAVPQNELAYLDPSLNRIGQWLEQHQNENLGFHDRCGAGCEAPERFRHLKNTSLDFGLSTVGRFANWGKD
jgi:hypothetical protein